MLTHLTKFESFEDLYDKGEMNFIHNKIDNVSYISKSAHQKIKDIYGDIYDDLYKKVQEFNKLFKKLNINYVDDILLNYFDGTNYNYNNIYYGIEYNDGYFFDNTDHRITLDKAYFKSKDKDLYLFNLILLNLGVSRNKVYQNFTKKQEERKTKRSWISDPRSRGNSFNGYNSIKRSIDKIKPVIYFTIEHKEYLTYWDMYLYDEKVEGWDYKEYDKICRSIESNYRLNLINPFRVRSKYSHSSYSYDENFSDRILLKDTLTLEFNI